MSLMPDFERDLVTAGEGWHSPGARLRRGARQGAPAAAALVLIGAVVFALVLTGSPSREVPAGPPPSGIDRLLNELSPAAQPAGLSAKERSSFARSHVGLKLDPARAVTVPAPEGAAEKRWLVVPGRQGLCTVQGARHGPGTCGPYQFFYEGGRVNTLSVGRDTVTFSVVVADGFSRIAAVEKRSGDVLASAPIVNNTGQLQLRENVGTLRHYQVVVQP